MDQKKQKFKELSPKIKNINQAQRDKKIRNE